MRSNILPRSFPAAGNEAAGDAAEAVSISQIRTASLAEAQPRRVPPGLKVRRAGVVRGPRSSWRHLPGYLPGIFYRFKNKVSRLAPMMSAPPRSMNSVGCSPKSSQAAAMP